MSKAASLNLKSSNLWDQLYFICELDDQHHIIALNNMHNVKLETSAEKIIGQSIARYVAPISPETREATAWSNVWDSLASNMLWQGLMRVNSTLHTGTIIYVKLVRIEDGGGAYFIAENVNDQVASYMSQHELLRDLTHLKEAFDEASIIAITDTKGVITYVNDKFCSISKYDRSELIGRTHRVINSKHHPKPFFENMWNTISQGKVWRGEVRNRAKDGSYYWMNTTIVPFLDEHNKPYQYVSIRSDITDRIAAETELAQVMEYDFRRTVRGLQNCIFKIEKNKSNEYIFTLSEGKIAEELFITTDQVKGKRVADVFHHNYEEIKVYFERAFLGNSDQFEIKANERYFYILLSPIAQRDEIKEVVASMIDITERKKAEEIIHYMAHYDALTHLPNRTYFSRELIQAITEAEQSPHQIAVLFIDLDRFKIVNDTMGHSMGDELLQQVAQRLQQCMHKHGLVSRQGGDEFALFLNYANRDKAAMLANSILEVMDEPFTLQKTEVYITPSIGISMYPDDGGTIEELLKCADAAMYYAKEKHNSYYFYTEELQLKITERLSLERDLRKAISLGELELWYQPKFDLSENAMIGLEALLRWKHPELGMVAPNHFIHIAEETNLIMPIGEWVLYEACKQMKQWLELGGDHLSVAVNISFRQFSNYEFPELIAKVLRDTGLPSKHLELEITESVAQNAEHAIGALRKIKELGVSVSIDDFGTGYSSLSYLSQFPIDRLKIDQSFVRNLNLNNQAIIRSIIDIANHMNITVIAEGVETSEQVEFLRQYNCQEAQGYFYSRPVPVHEVNILIGKYSKNIYPVT